jgi:hypothetical protein
MDGDRCAVVRRGIGHAYLIRRAAVERFGWLYWTTSSRGVGASVRSHRALISGPCDTHRLACCRRDGRAGVAERATRSELHDYRGPDCHLLAFGKRRSYAPAIAGVVPATVGMGLLLSFAMLRPLLQSAWREGRPSAFVAVVVLLISTILAAMTTTPALAILWGAGAVSALAQWQLLSRRRSPR